MAPRLKCEAGRPSLFLFHSVFLSLFLSIFISLSSFSLYFSLRLPFYLYFFLSLSVLLSVFLSFLCLFLSISFSLSLSRSFSLFFSLSFSLFIYFSLWLFSRQPELLYPMPKKSAQRESVHQAYVFGERSRRTEQKESALAELLRCTR